MNNKELAKLLLKHPLIIKINESQLWDKSVVSRVIAEELMREEEQEEEVDAVKEMEQKAQIVKDRIETLEKQLKKYRIEKRAHLFYDEEDEAEEYQALIDFANKEKAKAIKQLAKFSEAYDKLVSAAKETETPADDKTVSTAAANDSEKFEKISQIISQEPQNKSEAEIEPNAIEKINDDNIENAAAAIKNIQDKENAATATKEPSFLDNVKKLGVDLSDKAEKTLEDFVQNPENLDTASDVAGWAAVVTSIFGLGPTTLFLKAGGYTAKIKQIATLLDRDEKDEAIKATTELLISAAIDTIPFGAALKKAGGEEASGALAKKLASNPTVKKAVGKLLKDAGEDVVEKMLKGAIKGGSKGLAKKLFAKTAEASGVAQAAAEKVIDLTDEIKNLKGNYLSRFNMKSDFKAKIAFLNRIEKMYKTGNLEEFANIHPGISKKLQAAEVSNKQISQAIKDNSGPALEKINAIKEKGGGSEKINLKDFGEEISGDLAGIAANVVRSAIDIAQEEADTSGTDIEGTVGVTFADKWIKDNKLEDLSLFKDEKFKAEFARLLEKPGETQGLESDDSTSGDAADVSSSSIGNDNLDDSESLQEEAEVEEKPPETKAVSPEESAKVREEVQQVIAALEKSGLLNDPLERLLNSKLPEEGVTEEEVQNDVENQPEVEQFEYDEAVKQEMTTFFADEGANGLGFMQQILLRDQAAQLLGLIRNLDTIIEGPNAGEEKALTTGNESEAEKQEEPEVSQPAEEPTPEPQPVQEQVEQLPPLSEEEKSNIKKRMTGMVTLLKELRSTSKSYEKYMTRTSRNPRFDGSTLKKRLDETLPEVQRLIAEMVQDLKRYSTDSTIKESLMLEKDGMSRDEKIAFVKQEYLKMREVWIRMKPAFSDKEEKSGIINQAKEMKAIAANKDFLALFPNVTFVSEGEVISIDQANKVLSETIEQFVFAMRDVLTLVKSDRPERSSLIVAQKRLEAIAKAIQDNFGVPMGIPPELQIQQIEDEVQDEDNQALSDEDEEVRMERFRAFLQGSVDQEEDEDFGFDDTEKEDEFSDMSPEQESRTLEKEVEKFSKFTKKEEGAKAKRVIFADWVKQLLNDVLPKDYEEERKNKIWIKTLLVLRKAFDKELVMEAITQKDVNTAIRDIPVYLKSNNIKDRREILKLLQKLIEGGNMLELLKIINSRDVKDSLKKVIKFDSQEKSLEEALKPIIAKMLKEYHG